MTSSRKSGIKSVRMPSGKRALGRVRKVRALQLAQVQRALSERVSEAAAAAFCAVSLGAIRGASRGIQPNAQARQTGIYFAHVVFSLNLTRAGGVFGRDRTTARHACAIIEDRRENRGYDRALEQLEPALRIWVESFARRAVEVEVQP